MEIVGALKEVWNRKGLLAIVAVVAIAAALLSAYKLPSFEKRSVAMGAAASQILVDSPASTLVEGAESGALTTLAARAQVYAQYLSSLEARSEIAKVSGIPAAAISTSGPFSPDTGRVNYEPQPSEVRANDILKEGAVYRLIFSAQEGVPIITVSAQAPTAGDAVKLADASFDALQQYVEQLQVEAEKVPEKPLPPGTTTIPVTPDNGVAVRELGQPEGGTVGGGNDRIMMVFVFLLVLGVGCLAIAVLPSFVRQWRGEDPTAAEPDDGLLFFDDDMGGSLPVELHPAGERSGRAG